MSIKKKLKLFFGVILIVWLLCASALLYMTKDDIKATPDTIETRLTSFYDPENMGGFAVSVFTKDSILYSKGFGYADKENKRLYTTKTLQYIASISKTTIGISLLKAQELGLLQLDDPINQHLPFKVTNPNFTNKSITIRQLSAHTSSLDYNEQVVESLYREESKKERSLRQFMNDYFVRGTYGNIMFTQHEPGQNWSYSNIGAALATYIIEHKSNLTYADFTAKYIFEPLEMKNTHWFQSQADSTHITHYYEPGNNGIKKVDAKGVVLYPVRDMLTNTADLTRYGQAMLFNDPRILTTESYQQMLTGSLSTSVTNTNIDDQAVFWMIDRNQFGINYSLTGHNGGDYCINTMLWFDPKTELGYIFIGNTGQSEANRSRHILAYRTLVSLGDYYVMNDPTTSFGKKALLKWHNLYSRISSIF